jgi:HlyD family secretion protein
MRRLVIVGAILVTIVSVIIIERAPTATPTSHVGAPSASRQLRGIVTDGTLQAVTTVEVGTEVSGTIRSLRADFNSIVRKGQVLAELDPTTFQADLESARANLAQADADRDVANATEEDAHTKLTRATDLLGKQLIPQSDFDDASVTWKNAVADVKNGNAKIAQAAAAVRHAEVNLTHTIIRSVQTPVLFLLAGDLTHMELHATIDETDVSRVHTGDVATFSVDAYPNRTFRGVVRQVRLQPLDEAQAGATAGPNGTPTTQVQLQPGTVVAYDAILDVQNADEALRPGMTATISFEDHTL